MKRNLKVAAVGLTTALAGALAVTVVPLAHAEDAREVAFGLHAADALTVELVLILSEPGKPDIRHSIKAGPGHDQPDVPEQPLRRVGMNVTSRVEFIVTRPDDNSGAHDFSGGFEIPYSIEEQVAGEPGKRPGVCFRVFEYDNFPNNLYSAYQQDCENGQRVSQDGNVPGEPGKLKLK